MTIFWTPGGAISYWDAQDLGISMEEWAAWQHGGHDDCGDEIRIPPKLDESAEFVICAHCGRNMGTGDSYRRAGAGVAHIKC